MKLTYTVGRVTIEQDGIDRKQAFELKAVCDELFGEEKCGCCGSESIVHQVTHPGEYTYYKLRCMNPDCGAVLDFGQNKDMKGLFVKRWDSEARAPMPNNGWYVWDGSNSSSEDNRRSSFASGGQGGDSPQQSYQPRGGPKQGQGRPQQQQDGDGDIPF